MFDSAIKLSILTLKSMGLHLLLEPVALLDNYYKITIIIVLQMLKTI